MLEREMTRESKPMPRSSKIFAPLAVVSALAMVPIATAAMAAAESDTQKELDNFLYLFETVKENYVEPVDNHTLMKGAIDGMLAALDPHSSYAEGSDYEALKTLIDGNYGGIGLSVTMEDSALKVITPTEDTPGERAGIKAGDYITHIDGKLINGETLDQAVERLRGAPGSKVRITIVRPGRNAPFDVGLVREKIELRPVKWEVKDQVGIINLNQFSAGASREVNSAISAIDKATGGQAVGYILDMRENPGGSLQEAVEISDSFLNSGEIVSERGRDPRATKRWYAKPGDRLNGKPLIVLIDVGSASAAEIVAGALQDHRRAIVLGERSFGKGSVQSLLPTGGKTILRLTTARYYTPSGKSVQAGGIDPDIKVPQLSDPDYKTRPAVRENDLRRHLAGQAEVKDAVLESDDKPDPRFKQTAAELEKAGIEDFQLDYALKTVRRAAGAPPLPAAKPAPKVAKK
jgi:carboxyl-terminal processing protease